MCDQRSETFRLRVMWAALALLLAAGGLAGVSAQQREIIWRALAVQDYESRALPLSYGGGGPKVSESPGRPVLHHAGFFFSIVSTQL